MKSFLSFSEYLKETANATFKQLLEKHFSKSIVESKHVVLTTDVAVDIFNFLNASFFNNKLKQIPIKCATYSQIIAIMKARKNTVLPKNKFIGVYSVLLQNKLSSIGIDTQLKFSNDIILMNKTYLSDVSFAFTVASICHEMIHYYDRCFGEYPDLVKKECIYNIEINPHTTPTFMDKQEEAQKNGIDVISNIDIKKHKQYDYNAFKMLLPNLSEADYSKKAFNDTEHMTVIDDDNIVINTFN